MIRLLNGDRKNMVTLQKIKEWADGVNNLDRWDVSSGAGDRRDAGKYKTV